MASEKQEAIALANRLLNVPSADPDDDLRLLSRQFLRSLEIVDRQEQALQAVDWEGQQTSELIQANRDTILQVHEKAVCLIKSALISDKLVEKKLTYINEVLRALSLFHPMHGESWCGWPEV